MREAGGAAQTSLFSAFLSLHVSSPFLPLVDRDESCVRPSASFLRDPIEIPHPWSIWEGLAIEPIPLEGYSPRDFFGLVSGIMDIQN